MWYTKYVRTRRYNGSFGGSLIALEKWYDIVFEWSGLYLIIVNCRGIDIVLWHQTGELWSICMTLIIVDCIYEGGYAYWSLSMRSNR